MKNLFTRESKSIAGAALLIGVATVASRFLGLIRDRLLVREFGVGDQLDAYYAAFQIPNVLFALLVLGTLSVAFIPVFTEYLAKREEKEAWRMTDAILTVVLAVMAGLSALLILGAPFLVRLVAPGFDGEKLALTVSLTRVMMLTPLVFSVSAVVSSVLNSYRRFLIVAVAPLFYNASLIIGVLVLSKPFGIAGVAYGAVLGALLHLLVQMPVAWSLGMRFRAAWNLGHGGVRRVGKLFLPRVFGVDISQISQLIGSVIGTTLASGSVALFNLAMNIEAVPIGIVAIPFAIAAFPTLSEAAAKKDKQAFAATFASTFRQILFFLLPLGFMALALRVHVIRVVIGTGNMAWNDVRLAAAAFGLFMLSLAFQGLVPLLARAFYALQNTAIPVIVSAVAVAVNVGVAYAAAGAFGGAVQPFFGFRNIWLGLYGVDDVRMLALPLGFSAAAFVQVTLLVGLLRLKFGRIGGRRLLRSFVTVLAGSLAAGHAAVRVAEALGPVTDASGLFEVFLEAAVATAAGSLVYLAVLKLLKSEELESIAGAFRRRFLRLSGPLPVNETQEL